ncbi:amidase domain-containing protein [Brevibacterium linens]|uniref:amidase domain-containing protein n=1 Tax=Brevibacterium linens TaxID=1703 RepID=UPI003F8A93E4
MKARILPGMARMVATTLLAGGLLSTSTPTPASATTDTLSNTAAQATLDTYFKGVDTAWDAGTKAPGTISLTAQSGKAGAKQPLLQRSEVLERAEIWKDVGLDIKDTNTEQAPVQVEESTNKVELVSSVLTTWSVVDQEGFADEPFSTEFRKVVLTRASSSSAWVITDDTLLPDDYFDGEDSQTISTEPASQPETESNVDDTVVNEGEPITDLAPLGEGASEDKPAEGSTDGRWIIPPVLDAYKGKTQIKQNKLDRNKVVAKAKQWSKSTKMSPNFPKFKNNCANLASQSLRAGGWQYRKSSNHLDFRTWAPKNLIGKPTRTWSQASALHSFVALTGKGQRKDIWTTKPGDLIFADWGPNKYADGKIDHVMIVTGSLTDKRGHKWPRISQQSNPRYNVPLSDQVDRQYRAGVRKIKWYPMIMD